MKEKSFIKKKNRGDGFTLVEVLVSMAIFAVAMMAVLAMQMINLGGATASKDITTASDLAVDAMEQLFNMPFNDRMITTGLGGLGIYDQDNDGNSIPDRTAPQSFDGGLIDELGRINQPGSIFTRQYYVVPDNLTSPQAKIIMVDVCWPGACDFSDPDSNVFTLPAIRSAAQGM